MATVPPKKEEPSVTPVKKHVNTIALILPFQLDKMTGKAVREADVTRSALALDFYQGFKLALDSLSKRGADFKLQVLDSRDNTGQATALAKSAAVLESDLIIGPVVPDGIKAFGAAADLSKKLQVSPLAAAMPTQFNNPQLVTLNNSIDQHAKKLADFITKHYVPVSVNVVIINTRKTAEEQFIGPVRKYLNSLSKGKLVFKEVTSLTGIETKLSATKTNLIIMASTDPDFVTLGLNTLYMMNGQFNIQLFGHPNWAKARLDMLQLSAFDTHITSSYYVDDNSYTVAGFSSKYKRLYGIAPTEYAFNGFDTGYLFGNMLIKYGADYAKFMALERYNGLHNDFQFSYDPVSGYTNTNLMMLKYSGSQLVLEP